MLAHLQVAPTRLHVKAQYQRVYGVYANTTHPHPYGVYANTTHPHPPPPQTHTPPNPPTPPPASLQMTPYVISHGLVVS